MSETRELLAEVRHQHIATLLVAGLTVKQIAEDVKLSQKQVGQIIGTEEFRLVLREYADKLVGAAANTWKAAMNTRIAKALKVLDNRLEKDDLEAVKLVMKSIGVEKMSETQQSGTLQIVMPDLNKSTIIEVKE